MEEIGNVYHKIQWREKYKNCHFRRKISIALNKKTPQEKHEWLTWTVKFSKQIYKIYQKKKYLKKKRNENHNHTHFFKLMSSELHISFKDCTDQPKTLRSKPQVNKLTLQRLSSAQAVAATILLCPCLLDLGNRANLCPFKSNNLTCLLSWGIAMIPFDETESLFTAESERIVVSGDRMLRKSQTLMHLSSDPETTLSSRVKTDDVTLLKFKTKCERLKLHRKWKNKKM